MIAIPEVEWDVFYRMSAPAMVATLRDLAQRVNLMARHGYVGLTLKGLI